MAYCEPADLLLEDIALSPTVDKQKYVNEAADEINSKLGFIYKLPLGKDLGATAGSWAQLPDHEVLLLKTINVRLATGRLIMSIDAGQEERLNAYAMYLIQAAENDLMAIANGVVDLSAIRLHFGQVTDMQPSVRNHDEESLVLGFENNVMRNSPWYSRPGEVL